MITLVSSPKQHLRKDMQHSVCRKIAILFLDLWSHAWKIDFKQMAAKFSEKQPTSDKVQSFLKVASFQKVSSLLSHPQNMCEITYYLKWIEDTY